MYRIPLSYNPINQEKLSEVLLRYEGVHHNNLIDDFEKCIKEYTGVAYVVALNSGTAAIHLGLKALGVGPGDEVLVSTFTYVGSINPILYVGARPIFIDCERVTGNMDPELLRDAIKERILMGRKPKAIVVVHSMGLPAKMNEIWALSHQYNIPVIEDAAEAFGSFYQGKHVGTQSRIGVLSFNNNKILTTYGGGALLTNDPIIYKRVLHWANQAREEKTYYEHLEVGYSYRMGPINAAIGLAEWLGFSVTLDERKQALDGYKKGLGGRCLFLGEDADEKGNNWMIPALFKEHSRVDLERIHSSLNSAGIEVRYLWNPMDKQPAFKGFQSFLNGNSEYFYGKGLCLPASFDRSNNQVEVIQKLLEFIT